MRKREVTRLERVNERGFFIDLIRTGVWLNARAGFVLFPDAGQDFF